MARAPVGALSTGTISLALFVFVGFLIVTVNLERLGAEWSRAAEMSVYLEDSIVAEQRKAIEDMLTPSEIVTSSEYVSKAAAVSRFNETFSNLVGSIKTLGENPLLASYEVRLKAGPAAEAGVESLGARLRETAGVADVRYDRQWLSRLIGAIAFIRAAGLVPGAVLTVAAPLTVASVVRLALQARRDDVEIMQLVGAPPAYVRGPFVMEGMIEGGIGALVAATALATAF